MRFKQTVERTYKRLETTRTICDFCGLEFDCFDDAEVNIVAKLGDRWPECDCREAEVFDCCVPCWKGRVVPALHALGASSHKYDCDVGRKSSDPDEPEVIR